jgi:aspartate ammonia-lyase
MRIEKDSLGEKEVPEDALYGIHTCRSVENFDVAGEPVPLEIIYGMVKLKRACAEANGQLGLISEAKSRAIVAACDRLLEGGYEANFPIDVFQAGSGTSSNMNVNEVIGNLACVELGSRPGDRSLIHPNDDVNKGQSTNNIFPSAIRVAAVERTFFLMEELVGLMEAFEAKGESFADVLKSGRTHLQDAVPVTLGQEFDAWARALEKNSRRISDAQEALLELGVGGNAVGTGINTKPEFRQKIIAALNEFTGLDYTVAENGLEITQFLTDMGALSAALRLLALDLIKIVNDLRLLSSGPNTGLQELVLPSVEPGSSIMPGKINPSICEAANMACMQVVGNDAAISMACSAGQLELNTHMPLVGSNLIKSLGILERTCRMLREKCLLGIEANVAVCKRNFEISAGLPTILNPTLGYDNVALLVKESLRTGKRLRELVLEKELMSAADLDLLLSRSVEPNL